MPKQARLGDPTYGICKCHSTPQHVYGTITSASTDTFINGIAAARVGDEVTASCGHKGKIISGSQTAKINGKLAARVGDLFDGCYKGAIIDGSKDTFVGD